MYDYKIINIKHSMWTGKPKSSIEETIKEYAARGWRLVQVLEDSAAMWYKGRMQTKVIFEKRVANDFYQDRSVEYAYAEQDFV